MVRWIKMMREKQLISRYIGVLYLNKIEGFSIPTYVIPILQIKCFIF